MVGAIADCFRGPSQLPLRPHAIRYGCSEISWIALLSVRRAVAEANVILTRILEGPKALVETNNTTVQMARDAAGRIVGGQLVTPTSQLEPAVRDAVA